MTDHNVRQRHGIQIMEPPDSIQNVQILDEKKTIGQTRKYTKKEIVSNSALAILTLVSFITRFWKIDHPHQVVYYIKRTYFFDVHPPLAKLMFAAVGWLLGYDGHFEFDNIGDDYITNDAPYIGLRSLPAMLGALLVPLTYMIMIESGEFSNEWWFWMIASGVTLGLTLSVKLVGLFTVLTIGMAVIVDLWNLLDIRRGLTIDHFKKHFYARAVGLIIVPISVYLFWFYVHFAILTTSGPGDSFMSPAFQETLQGNAMSLESLEIRFNDTITLKHKKTSVFLHSHLERYPLRYNDGRISSQGQQVTGYKYEDSNNHWRVKPATIFMDPSRPEDDFVKHGDYILLEHVNSESHLLTHDVASPLMPTNQEFTTMPVDDDSRYNETIFQVLIDDGDSDTIWKTKSSYMRLIHFDTKVALWTHDKLLPEWAFKQQEINGNKNNVDRSNVWFADQIVGKNVTKPLVPEPPKKHLPFFAKFFELQRLMISHNSGLTKPHPYSSTPINWPFLVRGISFWTYNDERQQIYLLGNPFTWWLSVGAMAVLVGVLSADLISRRRAIQPISEPVRDRLYNSGLFFFMAWFIHYAPFFLMGRSLFLHHYLPALICGYFVAAIVFNFMFIDSVNYPISVAGSGKAPRIVARAVVKHISVITCIILLTLSACVFYYFIPLTYGTPGVDPAGIKNRMWLDSWDLHFQPKRHEAA
ncbi:17013_t:CDS:10 [Dentiscutata heterogama]|uniref:17013_t:CDS:1 n=1 Tax=Dentiscutata heterogama TaxID=1316150 RepID=A0ACA9LAV1_9GLOM|nr:17013_t:CDS:10 [Dentiscutata heterogama]